MRFVVKNMVQYAHCECQKKQFKIANLDTPD